VEQAQCELKRTEESTLIEPRQAEAAGLLVAHSRLLGEISAKFKQRMETKLVNVSPAVATKFPLSAFGRSGER
jgi:hypothetical protein